MLFFSRTRAKKQRDEKGSYCNCDDFFHGLESLKYKKTYISLSDYERGTVVINKL